MSVKSQLERVRAALPEGVTLVAVSKTHPIEAIKEAYESGQRVFGESRPQELRAKYEALPHDIEWHMIGHLQTNKIKYIAPFVAMIHSVDSERLAEAIQVQAAKCNRTIDVLLEIHVAEEESKSGWAIEDLRAAVASGLFERLPNVRVRGVMGIATNTDDAERIVSDFVQLRIYKEELAAHFGEQFDTLSMGMSDDYPTAIAAGSTMVRIGSTIFGERDYSK
jgi:pyridoxal phosphate enzyme (YggS family)